MSEDKYNKNFVPKFADYSEFYPFYLTQHTKPLTKLFHFVGTTGGLCFFYQFFLDLYLQYEAKADIDPKYRLIGFGFLFGYFLAFLSHAFIEKNKPATFKHPLWSFISDFRLWFECLTFQHRLM